MTEDKKNWNLYEHRVHEKFKLLYPNAIVEYNAAIKGVMSERSRQIDTLITNTINNIEYKIVLDAKYFAKKIDVKIVESFISFLKDVKINKGVLVTNFGFTKSALNRAKNDPSDIELQILTIDELPDYIGFRALVYKGPVEFVFETHEGWLVNGNMASSDAIAKIYPKKYDFEKAFLNKEYIYSTIILNIDKDHQPLVDHDFEIMLKGIMDFLFQKHKSLNVIKQKEFVKVDDNETLLLTAEMESYSEYVAIIDYEIYTILFGLVTPNNKKEENLKVLGYFVSQLNPIFTRLPDFPSMSQIFGVRN